MSVGQQLSETRRRDRMQRVMSGWWDTLQRKRQLAEARRVKLRQLLLSYLQRRQDGENQRALAALVIHQRSKRRRLAAIFAVWKAGGLRRLNGRRHDAVRGERLMARRALQAWRSAVEMRKKRLHAAFVEVQHRASVALLAAALERWRHVLYLRSLHEQLFGRNEHGEADTQLAPFAHWRRRCLTVAWQLWKTDSIDGQLNRRAENKHRTVTVCHVLSQWRQWARHIKQQRQLSALLLVNSKRAVFTQWRQALALQRQERRAAESLQSTLTATSLPFIRPLLLASLRPHVSSQPVLDWFNRWRAFVAHRHERLQKTTAAYQLYHHSLVASAFGLLLAEYRLSAHVGSFARSLAQHRVTSAVLCWHQHTQQRHTIRTVAQLSSAHHSSRLVSGVLSAWRQQCKRGAVRRLRCAEVERGVDALVVRSAFQRWHVAAAGQRRRQRVFTLTHCFLLWKWQTLRLRERRQLLQADNQSTVTTQPVAVHV